ncbi:MAG TPA: penicillin-binding transpeptidase domain-containing protein [Polyangiaceae bacterium]|nr:penicillin-binding transpeptidase domain-containing protein [Polyangiaceae bacterium]
MPTSKLTVFAAVGAGSLAVVACGPKAEPHTAAASERAPAPASAAPNAPATTPRPDARLTELPVAARPELGRAFDEERIRGGIALFDSATGELVASDPELAKKRFHPASTFKIAHSVIALELGVLDNPDSPMPWDGKYSKNEDWNRDHTLRTAMQVSCVPCFQRVARTIGPERMQDWLARLDYGNRDISGAIDTFWLTGGLRITAIEELDFLRRLDTGKLPVSPRTLDIVRDVIALDVGESHVLYGKTGLVSPPEVDAEVGWFVGFVALEKRSVYFATLVTSHPPDVEIKPVRRRVTERVLRSLGILPG